MESNSRWPNSARHGWRGIVHGASVHSGILPGIPYLTSPAPDTKVSQRHLCYHTLLWLCMLHIPPPLTLASSKLYCCSRPSSAPSLSSSQVLLHSHFLLQMYTGGANGKIIVPPKMVVSSLYEWSTDFRPRCSQCRGKDLPLSVAITWMNVKKKEDVDISTTLPVSYGADWQIL